MSLRLIELAHAGEPGAGPHPGHDGEEQPVLDALARRSGGTKGLRGILPPVEATIPRPAEPEPEPEPPPRSRVGREELLSDLESGIRITTVHLAMV